MRKITMLALITACATILTAPAAHAEERTCRGSLGRITVDNLRVPDGATCTLNGTTVKGTIKVESRATLVADSVRVVGNVQAEDAKKVVVRNGSRVGGSVQIVQGGIGRVVGTNVQGDILYDDQGGKVAAIRIDRRRQHPGVPEHRWRRDSVGNRVDGNLQCKENHPAPLGGNNIVDGSKEDQCSRL